MEKAKKYYVAMNDAIMSGWGSAQNRINKLVILCESLGEAEIVRDNALTKKEMKYVKIGTGDMPRYSEKKYYVSVHDKSDYGAWFVPNYFAKQ